MIGNRKVRMYTFPLLGIILLILSCSPSYLSEDVAAKILQDEPSCTSPQEFTDACSRTILSDMRIDQDSFMGHEEVLQSLVEGVHFLLSHPLKLSKEDLLFGKVPINQLGMWDFVNIFFRDTDTPLNQKILNYIANAGISIQYGCDRMAPAYYDGAHIHLCAVADPVKMGAALVHEARHADDLGHELYCPTDKYTDLYRECDTNMDKTHGWVVAYYFGLLQGLKEQVPKLLHEEEIVPTESIKTIAQAMCDQFDTLFALAPPAQLAKQACLPYINEVFGSSFLLSPFSIPKATDLHPILLADLDQDGVEDVMTSESFFDKNFVTSLVFLQGLGNGLFGPPQVLFTAQNDSFVGPIVVDMNHDGKLDVILLFYGQNRPRMVALLNQGNLMFQSKETALPPAAISDIPFLTAGDLNQDGVPDLLWVNSAGLSITIASGKSDGTFSSIAPQPCQAIPKTVWLKDLNQDGKLDAVVLEDTSQIEVWIGKGNGTFTSSQKLQSLEDLEGQKPLWIDFDRDGILDLLVVRGDFSGGFLEVFAGQGNGVFSTRAVRQELEKPGAHGISYSDAFVFDANQDGLPDLITLSMADSRITFFPGQEHGGFSIGKRLSDLKNIYHWKPNLIVKDIDRNGTPDLVFTVNKNAAVLLNVSAFLNR